jgi:hypothetical protein
MEVLFNVVPEQLVLFSLGPFTERPLEILALHVDKARGAEFGAKVRGRGCIEAGLRGGFNEEIAPTQNG